MRKSLTLFLLSATLLAACNSEKTLSYDLTFTPTDSGKNLELVSAVERVVKRRMAALNVEGTVVVVPSPDQSAKLTAKVNGRANAKKVEETLAKPFEFDLRVQKTEEIDPNKEIGENWTTTGVTGKDIVWARVVGDRVSGQIGVELQITPEAKGRLQAVFDANVGRKVGIFVRDFLVSDFTIGTNKLQERLVVSGIPNTTVAQVFADDVNVGLQVQFTPRS